MNSSMFTRAIAVAAVLAAAGAAPGALAPATAQSAQVGGDQDVIIILRDQLDGTPGQRGARHLRAAAVAAAQEPILAALRQAGVAKMHGFGLINAVAATVSSSQAAALAGHPLVQAVVPDRVIRARRRASPGAEAATAGIAAAGSASSSALCNTLEPEALQLTNAAFADPGVPQAQLVRDGNGQLVTGKGVKVAFVADGMDPTIPGFTHADGSPVFVDYQDFSGDPAGTPTNGSEAFGDSSSIAAQDTPNGSLLTYDISQFASPTHPLPAPCNVRIRGMAPGASLVGMKVFSSLGYTTNATILQGIEWAVYVDDVDVISESLGNPYYPEFGNDPVSLANAIAVRAGVTVTVASGDGGLTNSMSAPAIDPYVIAVGATTQFRFYAQNGLGLAPLAEGGYSDNNLAAFSSAGFAQYTPRTVDVVAPGDSGWALCSTNTALYNGCYDFRGHPAPIEWMYGTSESAPFTAAEAALVIQAYRSTHNGADPTPALVKRIIMSTATDLGAPAAEQGAGLINALKAVNVALSVADENGNPRSRGAGVLISPTDVEIVDRPGAPQQRTFTLTNTGSTSQHIEPVLQVLGPAIAGATSTLQLDAAADPVFYDGFGGANAYVKTTLNIPAGAQHLDVAIAFQTPAGSLPDVYLGLLDPSGRHAAYSNPFGCCNGYGHVDVNLPAPGAWTAVVWTHPPGAWDTYTGQVQLTWAAQRYVEFGVVHPAAIDLAPGASRSITASFAMPSQAGDLGAAIRFADAFGHGTGSAEIPVTMRALVPLGPTGGNFTGILTGGNGFWMDSTLSYEFDMPAGVRNMSLGLAFGDSDYWLEGLLIDPHGMVLAVEPNYDVVSDTRATALQLFRSNPEPGRWHFVLAENYLSSGNQTALPFSAHIALNAAPAIATGLPDGPGATLRAGIPVVIPVVVTNTGLVPEWFFADARLQALTSISLAPTTPPASLPGGYAFYNVPTQVSRLDLTAQSTQPIQMEAFPHSGNFDALTQSPDLFARRIGPDTVGVSLSAPEVPFGPWAIDPVLIGPFGSGGAPTAPLAMAAVAQMQAFDTAIASDTGDIWADQTLGTSTFKPLALAPGQSGTIHLTITPANQPGKKVSGYLYVDTYDPAVSTGGEVTRIPYSYTIVP